MNIGKLATTLALSASVAATPATTIAKHLPEPNKHNE